MLYPYMAYANALAAIDWLERAFGFERIAVYAGHGETVAHAEMRAGGGIIMLGSSSIGSIGLKSPKEAGVCTGGAYVYVPNPDEHYSRARQAGAEIVKDLADMEYGAREYTCRDLEGHLWSFGTYKPQYTDNPT